MLTRRELLAYGLGAGVTALVPGACTRRQAAVAAGVWVNDVHSLLNRSWVQRVERPATVEALQEVVRRARREGRSISIMGGRHAMGGQQFGEGTILVDAGGLDAISEFDAATGQVEVGAGIQWPGLVAGLLALQGDGDGGWGIVQKQTGADRLSIGGSLAANAHGRGLAAPLAAATS